MSFGNYIFDTTRYVFDASGTYSLFFDSGYINDWDFSKSPSSQPVSNPANIELVESENGYRLIGGYEGACSSFPNTDVLEDSLSDFMVALNQNYHRAIYDDVSGDFLGYETGSIAFATILGSSLSVDRAEINIVGSDGPSNGYFTLLRTWQYSDYSYNIIDRAAKTVGAVTVPSGPPKAYNYPSQVNGSRAVGGSQASDTIEFNLDMSWISASDLTITTRSTPYGQTSIKKIYFRDSANAIVFYEYLGQEYTQALRHGEGMMWHGLGGGYINKAIVHDHFAWVYIYGQKYLCKSLGQDLSVY